MLTRGEYQSENATYGVICSHTKISTEAILIESGMVVSAYKSDATGDYSFNNVKAKEMVQLLKNGIRGCTAKNGVPAPFQLGTITQHEFTKTKIDYVVQLFKGELVGADIQTDTRRVELNYEPNLSIPKEIPYIKLLTVTKEMQASDDDLDNIPVRSVQEIMLEKEDVTWLKDKKYYIVNDDETAEKIFQFLDNYNGVIAYDTETTGLRINCFGKVNSSYQKTLIKYNEEHPEDQIRSDKLVGIIFCVEDDVSYYFPCFNRKFDNLYQNKDSAVRNRIINNTKARYTLGTDLKYPKGDMYEYVMNTPAEEWTPDVVLMMRVKDILEKKHIVAHNGAYEWKVDWMYEIDTNLLDDTMIMHQIMYKFRSTTSNRGESSSLKYLAKVELGIDQWELYDFFPSYKEDETGLTRAGGKSKKKRGSKIDFSYMDYEGTRVYAPTDGDVTLQLFKKYKRDMIENHNEQVYIYSVEMVVACAVAYMEFYGHRLDEAKILGIRDQTVAKIIMLESEIRQHINYSSEKEIEVYNRLKKLQEDINNINKSDTKEASSELNNKLKEVAAELKKVISEDQKHPLNLASPAQVSKLFYDSVENGGLGYKYSGDKPSVAKRELKALTQEKNEDGSPKNIVAVLYSEYKKEDTLNTKFFDNLPYYMYPGGYIFSSFGQISTATGRMSCIEENTMIAVVGGDKPIKDVRVGDLVYCYDDKGNIKIRKVINVIDNGYKDCIRLNWVGHGNRVGEIVCTPEHKILRKDFEWVRADSLEYNDMAISLCESDRNIHTIISSNTVGIRHVYDLEVEEYHNFIANEICVHNCSKPNAQQYPKAITKIVAPRPGYVIVDADYSQIEYRVLTALANNQELAELFRDPDSDYHTLMASLMFEVQYASVTPTMRKQAKSFNFGIPYGMGPGSLAVQLTGKNTPQTRSEAIEKTEQYFKNQPNTRKFFENVKEQAQVNKFTRTLFNRYRFFSFVDKDGKINNAKKAASLRQAGNAVIQGTAADIFKISVARNFNYIRENKLYGNFLIINMIHDEQLMEVNVQKLNIQRIVRDFRYNMQYDLPGFPPLFIGAGVGLTWGFAKGEDAEMHPNLLQQLADEANDMPIWRDDDSWVEPHDVLDYFQERIHKFSREKIIDYLLKPENKGTDMHPAIVSLLNAKFSYGRSEDDYSTDELTKLNLTDFIKENNLTVEPEWFKADNADKKDIEDDDDYEDDEDLDELDEISEEKQYTIIDESDKMFGSSVRDIISTFGVCVLKQQRVCGVDTRDMYYKTKDAVVDYLSAHACNWEDEDGLEVVFLTDANILNRTGVKVKGVKSSELEDRYKYQNKKFVR